ncbi:MAG TPA: hypothetical protein VG983_07665, partial [Caulobacterales bacterium]|nr:hypothetical protein [Caulobacterales bacterium]
MAITALTSLFFQNTSASSSSAPSGLGADLLVAIAQSKNPVATNTTAGTTTAIKAPWDSAATSTPASTLVSNALSGKKFFDASTKTFSTPGLSDDARNLFALHAGVNTLAAIVGRYDQAGVSDGEKQRLAAAFASGMKQLDAFLANTKFKGLNVIEGQLLSSAVSKAAFGTTVRDYTTGVVGTGDPSLSNPAFEGDVRFAIDAEDINGVAKHIDVDLADMGAATRSLNSVVAFLNQKLTAAGLTSSFALDKLDDKTASGADQYALKLSITTGEGFSFSAPDTSPALYIVGGENALLKFQDMSSGAAAPPPLKTDSYWVSGEVDANTLAQADSIDTVRATATGADGSVYVLGDVTSDLANQPIKGVRDVALFKYDSTGHLVYSRVLGAAEEAQGFALAVDASGQVAIAGSVKGPLGDDAKDTTGNDSFVRLYDANGDVAWTARDGASADDEATALAFGSDGALYVGGRTSSALSGQTAQGQWDAYVRAYGPDGELRATQQYGGVGDEGVQALAVEDIGAGVQRVTAAGVESGKLVLRQFSDSGADLTAGAVRDLGSLVGGAIKGLALDGSDLYVAGNTGAGGLNAGAVASAYSGGQDGFVAKLSSDLTAGAGDRISYIGGAGDDTIAGIGVQNGQVWLAGDSDAAFGGQLALGDKDGYIARLESDGTLGWTKRFSEKDHDFSTLGFAFDASGASALDRLGLPRGDIALSDSDLLTSRTALHAGDQFSISVNGRSAQTIKIEADDTFQTLADRIERTLLSAGAATKVES